MIISLYICQLNAQTDTLVHRSEYESIRDLIYDINDPNEGTITYVILAGNTDGYYGIDVNNGEISIVTEISDTFNVIHSDTLTIDAGGTTYTIEIVDGFDYFINNLPPSYSVLEDHLETYIDSSSEWTVFNNLWGRGTAIPNVDFRIVTVHKQSLPDTTFLVWDVPGLATSFGGQSVWCYINVLWGNRKNVREDLSGFPFQINSLNHLNFEFEFEQLFGNDRYKFFLQAFPTNESFLANFADNDGDFTFTFDQIGTWVPPYPYSLPDTTILGKPFALRYDDTPFNGNFYEKRRIIIKNHEKLLSGTLDVKDLFDIFINANYLNPLQYISHMQLGIEVTEGYGAVKFNQFNMDKDTLTLGIDENNFDRLKLFPNPIVDILTIEGDLQKLSEIKVYDILGRQIDIDNNLGKLDFSKFPSGIYILKTKTTTNKVFKL